MFSPWRNSMSVLGVSAALFAQSALAEPQADNVPPGYWPLEQSQLLIDRTRFVRLAPDLSGLSNGERIAAAKLLEAGAIFQALYEQQMHVQALSSYRALQDLDRQQQSSKATQNLLTLYRLNQGPITDTLDNLRRPFLPADEPPPGKAFYPWGITKAEVEASLAAHPERRGSVLGLRSVVRRADRMSLERDLATLRAYPALATLHPGLQQELERLLTAPEAKDLYAVPYSVAYANEMMLCYELLNDAASAVERDDGEFARFLRNRARDLLSDDYKSGDASWVTGQFNNLNAQIGAYEVYDDELYGSKASLGLSLLILRKQETEKLRKAMQDLQSLEDALPYEHHKKIRESIPVGVYDVIADFGQARGSNTATVLPNESYLKQRYGRTILLRNNIIYDEKMFQNMKSGWDVVVAPAHKNELTTDGNFFHTLWHEVGHYLGVDKSGDGRELNVTLEEDSSVLEELKAELASLFSAEALARQGYYTSADQRGHYAAGINRSLVKSRPRSDQYYRILKLIQFNFYMEGGLLRFHSDTATLSIDYDRYHEVVGKLLAKVLDLQYRGDKAAADQFIQQYTAWDENLHEVIARKLRDVEVYRYWLLDYAVLQD